MACVQSIIAALKFASLLYAVQRLLKARTFFGLSATASVQSTMALL